MTNQEKQKLNEKLARWAGFEKRDNSPYGLLPKKQLTWWTPDDNWIGMDLPNFTDSLDVCFKWLVPKIAKMPNLHVIDYQYVGFRQGTDLLRHGWLIILAYDEGDYSANDNDPALAFCLAVEKLIEVME